MSDVSGLVTVTVINTKLKLKESIKKYQMIVV